MNFIDELSFDIDSFINSNNSLSVLELLEGLVHKSFANKLSGTIKKINMIKDVLSNYTLTVTDTYGINFAQVEQGGVDVSEINPNTFESLINPNIYILGEALNVDGACGGYNLYFAISSGAILAKNLFTN